jgi:hypothetical protein
LERIAACKLGKPNRARPGQKGLRILRGSRRMPPVSADCKIGMVHELHPEPASIDEVIGTSTG